MNRSIWESATERKHFPVLRERKEADVVIIGAGITRYLVIGGGDHKTGETKHDSYKELERYIRERYTVQSNGPAVKHLRKISGDKQ